ncbi:MAG: sugar ABC transporter permease [Clostridia bacterium]|nr:sugar ABC transporter permease [Clostridia bacterium]
MGQKSSKKMTRMEKTETLKGYLFISPYLIGFFVFTLFPMAFSFYSSFTYYDLTSIQKWIGFKNYINILTSDPDFLKALSNTGYYVLFSVPLVIVLALAIALLMNIRTRFMGVFRTIYYLPSVLSGVAVTLLWMWIFDGRSGLVNNILAWFGIQGPAWFFNASTTKPALIIMRLWHVGGTMVLFLAALQNVPQDLYEAGEIDGATGIKRFWHITLPMISPTLLFVIITGINGAFQIFDTAYVITSGDGGVGKSLLFYNLHLYNKAFKEFKMGYASAMAWILFAIIMFFTVIQLKISNRWVYYEGGTQK